MTKSDTIGKLAEALSKAQGAMKHAKKDSSNPFFKSHYADLASVANACRDELAANGLAVTQLPTMRDGKLVLEYVLMHSSGEYIASELEMTPVKADPQGVGSAITYARRYTLAGLAGVATEDDDGNAASGNGSGKPNGRVVERTTEDIHIEPPKKGAPSKVDRQLRDLEAEAKASLTAKPATLPEGAIEPGQAINFAKQFKDALKPELRPRASDIEHAWLKKQGIVDGDGNGTAKAILKANFYETRESGIQYAATLEEWG